MKILSLPKNDTLGSLFLINTKMIDINLYQDFLFSFHDKTFHWSTNQSKFIYHKTLGKILGYPKEAVDAFAKEMILEKTREDRLIISNGRSDIDGLVLIAYPETRDIAVNCISRWIKFSKNPKDKVVIQPFPVK